MTHYTTLAIVDDVNSCDCCGKTGLKSTVSMQRDDGEIFHFGRVCATRHTGRDAQTIKAEALEAYNQKVEMAKKEYWATKEYSTFSATLNRARELGIAVGKAFREFTKAAADSAEAKQREIAAKYAISPLCI